MTDQIFTIVVADDEEELREAVCRLVDWKAAGFELLGSAGNGLDALQMVEQLQPDLLLTDIQMPFITGTALARQVRQLQPLIQVAFLSGYDDFEYARSAIDSQVISYLLKPISMAELTEALRDIHRKMEDRFRAFAPSEEVGDLPLAAATLLLDSASASLPEAELKAGLRECGMTWREPCRMAVLTLEAEDGRALPRNAAQIVDKVLRRDYRCASFVSGRRILSLVIAEEGFSRLGDALDELYYIARRMLGTECTLGVSRLFDRLDRCAAACREAADAVRLGQGGGVHHIEQLRSAEEEMLGERHQASQLERILFGGSAQEMREYLSAVMSPASGTLGAMQVRVTARGVLQSVLGEEETAQLLRRSGLTDPVGDGLDPGTFRSRVAELCLTGQERLARSRQTGMSLLVERTMQIIDSRFMDEELSLGSVSEELHVSPNYLSANMKKYGGDTFINLLIRKRMEAARLLIQGGGMKISEVAQRCGYSDQHYFSFCFKKYFGISPAKMRKGEEADG